MKKQIWLVIFILVLMSVSLCAHAELGIDMETNMAYYGEWSKEGDTYFCKGPKQFEYYREGWLEDGSLCITSDGTFGLYISGAEEGKQYRTALFVPRSDGTYASICNVVSGPIVSLGIWKWNPVLLEPGLYEGFVAVVTSEDGEVFEHTFDVLCDPDVNKDEAEYSVTPEKKFFDTEQEDARYLLDNYLSGPFGGDATLPQKGISFMFEDRENVVFSGIDGMDKFYFDVGLNKKADLTHGLFYTVTLTEIATGKSFSTTGGQSWDDIQRDWQWIEENISQDYVDYNKFTFQVNIELPLDWQAGEYELRIAVNNEGEDALRIQLKKEFNPIPIYQKYCPDLLVQKNLIDEDSYDEEGWNWDSSVYYSEQGYLHLALYGVKPGEDYYALFQYTTPEGQTFTQYRLMQPSGNGCYENFLIATVAGTYEDIQLTVVGGGEIVLSRTFDMVVKTGVDIAPRGLVFGSDQEVKPWNYMGEDTKYTLEDYQTESGFFVPAPRSGVYQVTPAEFYSIYVHLAFNGEPEEEKLIIALIKAEDAGKPLEECERWWNSWTMHPPYEAISGYGGWPGIDGVYQTYEGVNFYGLPGNIPAGDYQLVVQLGNKTETVDITLQIIDEEMVMEEIRKAEEKNK